jgi:steroid delta-isomerase-like uncharacterized protein
VTREAQVRVIEAVARCFNAGSFGALDEVLGPGLDDFKRFLIAAHEAFPDAVFTIEEVICEGDTVVDRYTISGTHLNPFRGVPATGKRVDVGGISIVKIVDGRIVERRGIFDHYGLLGQLGLLAGLTG